ncbi:MAG: TIGR03364 family FAD-dependent oxidoreductase [Bacteroidota bacterium]
MKDNHFDIAVIGAGILGLSHAYHAASQGLRVVLFERNQFALGASIRNFGLVWPIGQTPDMLDTALSAREHWIKLAEKARFDLAQTGSLQLAYHEDELHVLEEFGRHYGHHSYDFELLTAGQVTARFPHIVSAGLKGALLSQTECTVDPRQAIQRLGAYMTEIGVDVRFGRTVTHIDMPRVATFEEEVEVERLVICSGADFETLYPSLMQSSSLTKCKLQMMKAAPIPGFELGPSLCAGLTLRHYDSFEQCPSVPLVDGRYDQENIDFRNFGVHVLLSQNAQGELIIGDSHEYGMDLYPFDRNDIDQLILGYLATFFKPRDLLITERWHGIYPKMTNGETHVVLRPDPGVTIVNGLGGAGMTLSLGLAERVLEERATPLPNP